MLQRLIFLQERVEALPHQDYPTRSRIHPLNSFFNASHKACFIKREDELGFGISGTKFRKYRTLIPQLIQRGYQKVVIIGGAYSNHILSLTQLLVENGLQPTLFLKGSKPVSNQGNFLLLQMVLSPSAIHWVAKSEWSQIEQTALAYTQNQAATSIDTPHRETAIIPEGATLFPALLGALTLPLDILRNEQEWGIAFDHLFIDVGTGYSAAALLLVFAFLKKQTECHLLLLADSEEAFRALLHKLHGQFEQWLGKNVDFPTHFRCVECPLAPSFGSTNRELFDFIVKTGRAEGFLLDPIYSGKLLYTVQSVLKSEAIDGDVLLIHSGGGLTLSGFQKQLESSL